MESILNIYCHIRNPACHYISRLLLELLIQHPFRDTFCFQANLSFSSLISQHEMTQQETATSFLFIGSIFPSFPKKSPTPLSECKVPGAWPEDEITLKMPGGWVQTEDDDWCQHILCCIGTAFGSEHFCSRHKNDGEVVEIYLDGLEL